VDHHPRETAEIEDESVVDIALLGADDERPHRLDVIQPDGLHAYAYWAEEVTRKRFLGEVGHSIVHSKVLVIDPLTAPVVVTGSHNFSETASTKNDENFIVIRGDEALAEAYMVNILAAWRHYRFRVGGGAPYEGLDPDGSWMARSLWARKRDSRLWGF
jgi:phosphatidylserine/phosphatidylglycerophosphate/cardiolipin synthase-like enzyme